MMRPAAPGPRIGVGRIRVDAARAIAKLREYQLVERAAWVLEGIRAAVAAQASEIALAGDANDIWLSWRGEPWPAEDLTRLFDELVSPEAANERHHLRLLAAAVNSGLGLAPAYIDVIAVHDDTAIRARYTPDVLDDPGADVTDSPLRHLTTETIPVPDGAQRGMRVHLRRRASLQVLSYLFGEPPELEIARRACVDIPVLLEIGTNRYHRVDHARDVVRVPLGDGLDGFLAVADPDAVTDGVMNVAERGVVLARYPLSRSPDTLPIRLLIDAPRMPTNASRSQVQRDSHPIAAAERRVAELLPALVAQLIARLEVDSGAPRTAALALLAGIAGIVDRTHWWKTPVPESSPLAPLADLPLLRDATGTPRPLRWHWSGLVYRASKPLHRELEPWVDNIVWVPPGDPSERLVSGAFHDQRELRRRLRAARQQRRDHDRFFAHAARPPTVISKTPPIHRLQLGAEPTATCVPQRVFEGLAGEVCIYADDGPSALVVLHHGREIERLEFDSPVRFEAVVDAPAITPAARFRGVVRDLNYTRVDRAMRAGVLRAIEAIATTCDTRASASDDRAPPLRVIQGGLALARSLGATVVPPLASAPAWRSVDGDYLSHAALVNHRAIGIVDLGIEVTPPAGRVLLRCDHEERSRLSACAPELVQIVYTPATARPVAAEVLASRLSQSNTFALAITDETRAVAIAPAGWTDASITLQHRGVALSTKLLGPIVAPCKIVVDCETITPTAGWNGVLDEGAAANDYHEWVIALVRATARALVGERPLELLGPRDIDVHGTLGQLLCIALANNSATELLGAELLTRLRAHRMLPVLGDPDPHSIDQLCARFSAMIPYVGRGARAIAGFSPLLADELLASAVATLAGLPVREASLELEMRRHAEVRTKQLARHREQPVQPLELPNESVEIAGPVVRGVVGVGTMALEIQVLVEGRPFYVIRRDQELPLRAMVEIDSALTMPAFDGIPVDVTAEIVTRVTEAAPPLLLAIAIARPHILGDRGPARRLLASCVDSARIALAPLRAAPIFPTVQGGRTSITAAQRPYIATTVWPGTWLAREQEPVHPCDLPIVHITDITGEIPSILQCLHDEIVDVTHEVAKLQRTRRVARGLIPAPAIPGVAPALKRPLAAFGDVAATLGHGEIALVDDESSSALLHVNGELRKVISIDVSPSIQLAIEAPDLVDQLESEAAPENIAQQLRALKLDRVVEGPVIPHAQELAIHLTRTILSELPTAALGPLIRRNLARAMFRGSLAATDLATVPVFETTTSSWIDPSAVDRQITLFGNAWAVPHHGATSLPLDDRRIVLRIDPVTIALARERGVVIIDATEELALDARARRNRDKPLATTLAFPDAQQLAHCALDGDGITGPRGVVGILHPAAAHRRGLYAHRGMHPFDVIPETGTWPIIAVFDDARFVPDRTWDRPVDDATWRYAHNAVREAGKRAFKELIQPPADALAVQRLVGHGYGDHRFTYIRGALWIAGPPLESPPVHVVSASGARDWTPRGATGVTGVIYSHSTDDRALATTLEDLCALVHGLLVRGMVHRRFRDRPLVTAHVAHALALDRIPAREAGDFSFPCVRPGPLPAADLVRLFADTKPIYVVAPTGDDPGVVDDGSLLSRVVLRRLHDRIQRRSSRVAPPVAPPVEARHPLQPLLEALRARFAQLDLDISSARLVDRADPMFEFDDYLRVAGRHPRLIALGAALEARSPWAGASLDAIVAHGATVLNVALASVTDAAELHAIGALLEHRRV
ncbi:MAG: hypothetical protein ACKV2T_00510 [Kofleriaceae bacterium]